MTPQQAIDAARLVADALVALVPPDAAKQLIDDATARRSNAIATSIGPAKCGPKDGG